MLPRPWPFPVYKASSEPSCSTRHSSDLMPPRYLSGSFAFYHPSWFPCFGLNWHLLFLGFGRYTLETLLPEARVVCPSCSTTYCFSHQNAAISFCPCVTFFSLHSHKGTHMNLHCLRTCFTCNFSFWKCSVRRSETSQWELSTIHLPLPTSVCSCQEYGHSLKEIITSKCFHWDKLYWFHAMI